MKKETTAASECKLDLPVSKDIYINLAGAEFGLKSNHCKKKMEVMTILCVTEVNANSHLKNPVRNHHLILTHTESDHSSL